jgi:hypothetical protein
VPGSSAAPGKLFEHPLGSHGGGRLDQHHERRFLKGGMDALLYILGRIDIEAINERPEPVLDQLVVQLLSHRARIAPAVAEEDHPLALLQAERFMYEADNPGQGVVTQPCLAVERVKRRWRMRLEIALVVYDGKHENAVGQGLIDLLAALCRRRPGRAAQVHGHGGTIAVSLALGDVAFADLDRASRVAVNGYGRIKVVPERPHPGPAIGMDAVHGVGHLPPALRPGLQPSTIPSAASCLTSLSARQIAAQTSHRVLKRYRGQRGHPAGLPMLHQHVHALVGNRVRDQRQQPGTSDRGPLDPPVRPHAHRESLGTNSPVIAGMYVGSEFPRITTT